jgi:hypothetical protein
MKTTIFRSRIRCIVLAGALVAPAQLPAQGQPDSVRTHVVQRGETLWSLAATYLGNGHRWREILAMNSDLVRAADSLPVGATLRLPPARPATGARTVRPPAAAPIPAGRVVAPPAARTDSAPPRRARVDTAIAPPGRVDSTPPAATAAPPRTPPERTIFFGARPGGGFVTVEPDSSGAPPAPLASPTPAGAWEALSAPYVIEPGVLRAAGSCVRLGGAEGAVEGVTAGGALLRAAIAFNPPPGVAAGAGDRFVLVRPVGSLTALGTVVVPTGVLRVSAPGSPAVGEIVAQFDVIACRDAVVAAQDAAGTREAAPVPVAAGASGRVAWVGGDALLPALRYAVIVDIGAAAGVRPGDVVSIYAADGTEVAAASVVRVDALSSSALIIRRPQAGIVSGLAARITAKVP